ncbi:MAG: S-layer homology domain-containing protein [Acidaminococcaceae bacterium]|nr:S-layer homology domain-containing protein [Acidaminococcaceae bacterium]
MKKSLVLAMAMALGVTASAYAANPFSDVPAGHWAYDSISKLAAAGIIEGYGDDTFRGDRLMTRYEMAQIVAKALAKGANVDKLAAEFADELDALGVRVAALEKKADNVKITGQIRWHYASIKGKGGEANTHTHQLRTRILLTGKVNDTWNYVTMLENRSDKTDYLGDEGTGVQRAYLDGRLGGAKVMAGRWNLTRTPGGDVYDNRVDGVKIGYGNKVKLEAYYAKLATASWKNVAMGGAIIGTNAYKHGSDKGYAWGVNAAGKLGDKVTLYAGYDQFNDKHVDGAKDKLFDVGLTGKFGDFTLDAIYLHGDADWAKNEKGFVVTADYKGASFKKAGTWGLEAKYYNQGDATIVSHTMNGVFPNNGGFKGYKVAGYYALAKGMVAGVEYYDLKAKESDAKDRTLWTELQVRF